MSNKRRVEFPDFNEAKRARAKTNRFGTRESTGTTNYHHLFEKYVVMPTNNVQYDRKPSESKSTEEIFNLVSKMTLTIENLSARLNSMAEELRRHKSLSALEVGGGEIMASEMPLLDKLQTFELPIRMKEKLHDFETQLKEDLAFKQFCVSLNNSFLELISSTGYWSYHNST